MGPLQEDKYSFPKEMTKDPEPGRGLMAILAVCAAVVVVVAILFGGPMLTAILVFFQKTH